MKVVMVLPTNSSKPIGGYKVTYEYANGLAARGHQVTVVHRRFRGRKDRFLKAMFPWVGPKQFVGDPAPWFEIQPTVNMQVLEEIDSTTAPDADVILATSWYTAEWVARLPGRCGRKFYLVQDYEFYMSVAPQERARIARTFQLGMTMLAISPAIAQMLQREGVNEFYSTPNGLDIDFLRDEPQGDESQRAMIGFPNRGEGFKRTADAIAAVSIIREKLGADTQFWSFGTRSARAIPPCVQYFRFPSDELLRSLYHRTRIFMVPSQYEGWGLPGSEAMACGAALVSTDNGGVRGYARDNENAFLCPPGRPDLLANAVIDLWNDRPRLYRIAEAGKRTIQQFAWQHAIDRMEKLMLGKSVA